MGGRGRTVNTHAHNFPQHRATCVIFALYTVSQISWIEQDMQRGMTIYHLLHVFAIPLVHVSILHSEGLSPATSYCVP